MGNHVKLSFGAESPNWLKLPHPVPVVKGPNSFGKGQPFLDIVWECKEEVDAAIAVLQAHKSRLENLTSEEVERMCYLADVPEGSRFFFLTDGRAHVRAGSDQTWCACVLAGEAGMADTNIRLMSPLTRVIPSVALLSSV